MPVAGAMDPQAFMLGNIIVGNGENAAALEVTLIGPTLRAVGGEGVIAVTGADLAPRLNGEAAPCWTAIGVSEGDTLSFAGPRSGCRAYICFSGGIDLPAVMGSRSTYTRAGVGGFEGRPLKRGDLILIGEPEALWKRCRGFSCPGTLRAARDPDAPIRVIPGPQDDLFTERGRSTFYGSGYIISESADRMGYRMEGPGVEHSGSADIISDAVPLGAVQVPGDGKPVVMLADRQTTGGYPKIGVVCSVDAAALSQRIPGMKVRFAEISREEGVSLARAAARDREDLRRLRAEWRSRSSPGGQGWLRQSLPARGEALVRVDGEEHLVSWEEIQEV
jgi:biotin-dependent carboxylase-like uncharacterized protein